MSRNIIIMITKVMIKIIVINITKNFYNNDNND